VSGLEIATAPPRPSRDGPSRDGEVPDGFLGRPEVRDVLAWLRLLVDPEDASAVARALARPPVELRQVDLARVIQVARRRKLDLVVGVGAAIESPQVPPEARERIERFASLHRVVEAELHTLDPAAFLAGLIDRLGLLRRRLMTPADAARSAEDLGALRDLAGSFLADHPDAGTIALVRHLAAVAAQHHDRSIASSGGEEVEERLERTLQALREELAEGIGRIGDRLGELRLDTDLDISHGVVRYLELLKVSALIQRPPGQDLAEALADINTRLLAAVTPLQREILQTSTLDQTLLAEPDDATTSRRPIVAREELSLEAFLPRRGAGVAMSASDIQTYRACPLRYKFARVLRIPVPQTVQQRFGIVIHQVLERYHSGSDQTLEAMLELLEQVWRRSALGETESDLMFMAKARDALCRYHARLVEHDGDPVWFERSFSFRVGPHHLRGRVDRVDRLSEDAEHRYELIDYKTSRPRTPEELCDDVQLSLYALAAREDWHLESSRQSYYYVLDDLKVPVPDRPAEAQELEELVLEVGAGILAQRFEPTPSPSACAICDYRVVCPAAEAA
jgi:CRISPR/Cas system-associated exonuclease Cas4 (RecB family)